MNRSLTVLIVIVFCLLQCTPGGDTVADDQRIQVTEQVFGTLPDGRIVRLFTLQNSNNIEVSITNWGGIITSVMVPDRDGEYSNVVLGFDNFDQYLNNNSPFFGAIVGRYANRIEGAGFVINGEEFTLTSNNGPNHIHGGRQGFDKKLWTPRILENGSLELSYRSEDGEEGYPGNVDVTVVYQLTNDNELAIEYNAVTDQPTHINLTNHSYFNLTGDTSQNILGHELYLAAREYTPFEEGMIPTGELRSVEGTPFDFTERFRIGDRIDQVPGGYDHNFVLSEEPANEPRLVGSLHDPVSGRTMEVHTTEPGVQLYTANFLNGNLTGAMGNALEQHAGLCLETQHFPNSPNEPGFPSTLLDAGEVYNTVTIFKFLVE